MRGVNKAIIVGNLGNDPDVKYTQGGTTVTTISVATSSSWKDKDGNAQERTEWHRVKFFGKLAEIAGEYLKKGGQVYIEGSIRYDKFTGTDGNEKYITEIIADEMQMLGSRNQDGDRGGERSQSRGTDREQGGGQARGVSPQSRGNNNGNRNGGGQNNGGNYGNRGGSGNDRGGYGNRGGAPSQREPAMAGGIDDSDDIPFGQD